MGANPQLASPPLVMPAVSLPKALTTHFRFNAWLSRRCLDFEGYVRPDHGRMIWGETGKPGYGLYDRALGAVYLNGLWEGIAKAQPKAGRRPS